MSISLPNTLDKCGECRADFYGDHLEGCLKEEALETCGECESFYVREESPYARPCQCSKVICGDCLYPLKSCDCRRVRG